MNAVHHICIVQVLTMHSNMLLTRIRPSLWIPACEVRVQSGRHDRGLTKVILTDAGDLECADDSACGMHQSHATVCATVLHWPG